MLGLKVFCWAYLVFILMGRIVNYDKCDAQSNQARFIDNLMIVALVIILAFLMYMT